MRTNDFLIAIRDAPETNIVLFGFLISFPWEMLQAPLYIGMAQAPHWSATLHCLVATLGDCALFLLAFGMTAAIFRNRHWIRAATFFAGVLVYSNRADGDRADRGGGGAGHWMELAVFRSYAAAPALGHWPVTLSSVADPATTRDSVGVRAVAIRLKFCGFSSQGPGSRPLKQRGFSLPR